MRYYIIAGEASGDKHGAKLVTALLSRDKHAEIRGWGGDLMREAGADIVKHYKDLAFMGFVEVLKNLITILGNFKECKSDILSFKPDCVILIDYPGFNLRMGRWLFEKKIKVIYFISPQIWAWNEKRVHAIKKHVDEMFVILPFEAAFYRKYDMDVTYVGHPLKGIVDEYRDQHPSIVDPSTVALLPGSRRQEIKLMMPIFAEVAQMYPSLNFVVAMAPHIEKEAYRDHISEQINNVQLSDEGSYALLNRAGTALCTSGTATLETALFKVPQVVCYRGSGLNYFIAKRLISVKFISLVNLIVDQEIVKELIQYECNATQIAQELKRVLPDPLGKNSNRHAVLVGYEKMHQLLTTEGEPANIVAEKVIASIS